MQDRRPTELLPWLQINIKIMAMDSSVFSSCFFSLLKYDQIKKAHTKAADFEGMVEKGTQF